MVHDEVWAASGLDDGMLCITCLERRVAAISRLPISATIMKPCASGGLWLWTGCGENAGCACATKLKAQ
jgi:hypothetical protein